MNLNYFYKLQARFFQYMYPETLPSSIVQIACDVVSEITLLATHSSIV